MTRTIIQSFFTIMFLLTGVSTSFALPKCTSGLYHNCWGSLTFESGARYDGEFKGKLFHGKGTLQFPSGGKYVGWFWNGQKSGKGTQTWSDGSKYTGDYKNDTMNGKGEFIYASGDRGKYIGEWNNGKRNGHGTFTWAKTGNVYVGRWKDDARSGKGKTSFPDGTVYEGFFQGNRFIEGIFIDKFFREGTYKNGTFNYTSDKPTQTKISLLEDAFTTLSTTQRKLIQSKLSELGFYRSSIDGLYGNGTATALFAYNKQYLNDADLEKSSNVSKLITSILTLKASHIQKSEVEKNDNPDKTFKVASGTGFYASAKGHIITNHHVINGCQDIKVHTKGKVLETIKIADDARNDLAILKVSQSPSHVFALSNESPFPLQEVIVAGFPFGDRVSSTLKFTKGIVSSLAGMGNDYSQIQIDAALQPGNSGGPIMDDYGNIIGVAVAKLSLKKILKDYGVVPENTNFGVKTSAIKNLMEGNQVPFKSPNTEMVSKQDLARFATDGTVFLTCWMTTAQLEQMRTTKVLFEDLD